MERLIFGDPRSLWTLALHQLRTFGLEKLELEKELANYEDDSPCSFQTSCQDRWFEKLRLMEKIEEVDLLLNSAAMRVERFERESKMLLRKEFLNEFLREVGNEF